MPPGSIMKPGRLRLAMDGPTERDRPYSSAETAAFAGSNTVKLHRWVVGKLITPKRGERVTCGSAEYLFTERQVMQAAVLARLMPSGRTSANATLKPSQLRNLLRRMPETEPHENLWLIIERSGPRCSYSWTTDPAEAMHACLGRVNMVDAVTMTNTATGQRIMPILPALKGHQTVSVHSVPHPAVAFGRVVAPPKSDEGRVAARPASSSVDPAGTGGETVLSCQEYPTPAKSQPRRRPRAA
jgi:hypothetical protein